MIEEKKVFSSLKIKYLIFVVYISSFILPSGLFQEMNLPITKYFFIFNVLVFYAISITRISFKEVGFIMLTLLFSLITGSVDVLHFISIVTLYKLLKNKQMIKEILIKDKFIWPALVFTIIYIVIYLGEDNRLVHTSIIEINQSGLAIFCLALIIHVKNKYLGRILLVIGLLTLSRSYFLALIITYLFNIRWIKSKFCNSFIIKKATFLRLLIISSAVLLLFAFYYEYLFFQGELSTYNTGFQRLFDVKDISNYFRFIANKNVIEIFITHPIYLLTGIPNDFFHEYGFRAALSSGQIYRNTNPHNFMFTYLKLYGLFAIPVFIYISNVLKRIVDKGNFNIYLAFMTYAMFLGVGFNHYWLYLLVFVLIVYSDDNHNSFENLHARV